LIGNISNINIDYRISEDDFNKNLKNDIKPIDEKNIHKILFIGEKLIHLFFTENGVYTHFDIKNENDLRKLNDFQYKKEITFKDGKKFNIFSKFGNDWDNLLSFNRKKLITYDIDKDDIIKVEPAGELEIAEDVVIHNNSVIDKGIFGKTFIGENTKIYNLVHVAHDSKIGKNVFLTAGVIVCGRVKISANSYLGPNCTIKNGLFLGENSKVSMGAVVTKDVKDNEVVTGNFAIPHEQFISNLKKI